MTQKLLVFVFHVLVSLPRALRALDCHLQLGYSHSHFIFGESNSSGGMEGPKEEMEGKSSLAACASARGQRKGACHRQAFRSWHQPPSDPGLLGLSQLHTAYGAPWHPQKLSLQPALTMECPTAERNRGGKIPGKGNGHKLLFYFYRMLPELT